MKRFHLFAGDNYYSPSNRLDDYIDSYDSVDAALREGLSRPPRFLSWFTIVEYGESGISEAAYYEGHYESPDNPDSMHWRKISQPCR